MHPDDQAFVDRLPAQLAKFRERYPQKPARDWEDEEGIYSDPRPIDHPAFSPTTQQNLTSLFEAYQKEGQEGLAKKYDELVPTQDLSAPNPVEKT